MINTTARRSLARCLRLRAVEAPRLASVYLDLAARLEAAAPCGRDEIELVKAVLTVDVDGV